MITSAVTREVFARLQQDMRKRQNVKEKTETKPAAFTIDKMEIILQQINTVFRIISSQGRVSKRNSNGSISTTKSL